MPRLAFFFLLLAACSSTTASAPDATTPAGRDASSGASLDAGAPDASAADASAAGDAAAAGADAAPGVDADNAACEAQLVAEWAANPPSLGLANAASASAYDAVMQKLMRDFQVPGGAVAVMSQGQLVFAKGYGFSDSDAPQPVNADDLFRLASVTKQVTSAEVLKLVEAGLLSLDDHPFTILADLQPLPGATRNPQLADITVRNLLQHTGGWNRDVEGDPMFESITIAAALGEPGPASCTDTIRYMLDKPLDYTPGTTYCYSNFGYCVLGRVIERISQQAYSDAVATTVLEPAGTVSMAQGHSLLDARAEHEVLYYDYPGAPLATSVFPSLTGLVPWPYGGFNLEAMDSHGAWIASPVDLLRFQRAIDGRGPQHLLSPASLTEMTADPAVLVCETSGATQPETPGYWYGYGWQVNKYGNWWHTGSLPGASTETVRASNGYGWAIFLNTRPTDSSRDTFDQRVDSDLWQPLNSNVSFLPGDLFDQYVAFSAWMSETDYAASSQSAGHYPSRVEGRLESGNRQYRAQFVPLHAGATAVSDVGLDCASWRAKDAALVAGGYERASLQWFVDGSGLRRFQASWILW